ncbi:MAG: SulP family inorganic anion transporter, partial [Bacteroidia bacterium]|nr:SulP family inorganic anion transporter [Bacteroidia bacterium]
VKQTHELLGVVPVSKEPFDLIIELNSSLQQFNPATTFIGCMSILILFIFPLLKNRYIQKVPPQLLVIFVSIFAGIGFGLEKQHTVSILGYTFQVGPQYLVNLPEHFFEAITFPDFSQITSPISWKYILMFLFVGTIESLLSAKAIDLIDPHQRKSNLNQDLVAIGIGNTISAFIGGLPMISEIVRSSANINQGAKTRWSNFFHGFFLFIFILFASNFIERIPLAALAGLLIVTGYRLGSPKTFIEAFKVGPIQFLTFTTTVLVTLKTDLLLGVLSGVFMKFFLLVLLGADWRTIFYAKVRVFESGKQGESCTVFVKGNLIFTNLLSFQRQIQKVHLYQNVTFDFRLVQIIDHSANEYLHELFQILEKQGKVLTLQHIEKLKPISDHPFSVRMNPGTVPRLIRSWIGNRRMQEMEAFGEKNGWTQFLQTIEANKQFRDFYLFHNRIIVFIKNQLYLEKDGFEYRLLDAVIEAGHQLSFKQQTITLLYVKTPLTIPRFQLSREGFWDKVVNKVGFSDINFETNPNFSDLYQLRGDDENAIRNFFQPRLLSFLEKQPPMNIESNGKSIVFLWKEKQLSASELSHLVEFAFGFIQQAYYLDENSPS